MKVILLMVSSLNGKITKGNKDNIYSWTSKEDSELFFSFIEKHNLIVMGSKTYDSVKDIIRLKEGKLRIVLTQDPTRYEKDTISDQLEFSSKTPNNLIEDLEKKGYKEMLLVGGGIINTLFLKAGLIDEIYLTIEPFIFGQGKPIFAENKFNTSLKLITMKQLNKKGTISLQYKILKTS